MEDHILVLLGGISTISASLTTFFNAGSKSSFHLQTAKIFENLRVHLLHCNSPDDLDVFSKNYTEAIKDAPFLPFFLKEHRSRPEYYMDGGILGREIRIDENSPEVIKTEDLKWSVDIQHDPVFY